MARDSRGRRSAQTALYLIAQAFVRWMAPVLSFTAEEVWQFLPDTSAPSVFLTTWDAELPRLPDTVAMNASFFEKMRAVRDAVNKQIEAERNANRLGSALEAEVVLYADANLKSLLDSLENELRFLLITSSACVKAEHEAPLDAVVTDVAGLRLIIHPTMHAKCDRCWHRREDVNKHADYPGLCSRCVENEAGPCEIRRFA